MNTTYGYNPFSYELIESFESDNPDLLVAEKLIQQGADVNSQNDDKDENVLSEIFYVYHSSPTENLSLTKIIKFFLDHGFDVTRNEGRHGAQCLKALTYSPLEKEIIDATKMLLDAGAKNIPTEDTEPDITPMSSIGTEQSFQDIGEGNHYLSNIYEAVYQIYVALEEGKSYSGIDSFETALGKNILRVMAVGDNADSIFTTVDLPTSKHKNCFYNNLYMIFDGGYLICTKYGSYWVDTAPIDEKVVDVSKFFSQIIGHKICKVTFAHNSIKKGITHYGQPVTTFQFDNDVKLTFSINFGEVEKEEYCSYCYYNDIEEMDKLEIRENSKQALFGLQKAQNDEWEEAGRYIEQEKKENRTLDEMIEDAIRGSGLERIELADAYENGDDSKGIPIDYEEAVYWYGKSLYGTVNKYDVCLKIADIFENKICDKKIALNYYRRAYLMDDVLVPDDERQALSNKINDMTKELFPDKDEKVTALKNIIDDEQLSDSEIRELAKIMGDIQFSVYEEKSEEKEKEKLLRRIPTARVIVNAAFNGRGVGENALGVFYEIGVILPMNFDKAEYWYLSAYTDGYDTAYENLTALLLNRRKEDEWINFIILAARDGIEDAKKKCNTMRLDCMKIGPVETKMLDYYSPEKLIYKDATEEQIELLEQFVLTNDKRRKRDILFQLVPPTTDEYVDAFLNGKPYPTDAVIDKLMDTDDWQTRKKIISESEIEVSDEILRSVPYMPLSEEEQKCIFLYGHKEHKRSPYREYAFTKRWNELTEKEKTLIKVMDADHRLTFDIAEIIVDDYEKKLVEDEQEKQPSESEQTSLDEEHIFWLDYGNDSCYMKRQAYATLKLNDKKITEETLRQVGANRLLNHINMEINPILNPLVSFASKFHFERMIERFKEQQEI